MTYNALAIDLDGTLLVGEDIPAANVEALKRAKDAGFHVFIATARWAQLAMRIQAEIGLEDPVIACSGAHVYDPSADRDVFDERLPLDFAQALFEICNQERCIATITLEDRVLLKLDGQPDTSAMAPEMQWVPQLPTDISVPPRVAAIQGSGCNRRVRDELGERFADRVNILDSVGPTGRTIVMMSAKSATKGAALSAACAYVGTGTEQVVAFGDAENDVDMFAAAGAAVAMGQADDATKAAATFVTKSNTEAGVAYAVERLLERGSL